MQLTSTGASTSNSLLKASIIILAISRYRGARIVWNHSKSELVGKMGYHSKSELVGKEGYHSKSEWLPWLPWLPRLPWLAQLPRLLRLPW